MPITKSAKKSLRASRTKETQNQKRRAELEKAFQLVNKDNVSEAISLIDKAAKTGVIAKNKAARLKSRLAKKFGTPKLSQAKKGASKKPVAKAKNLKSKKTVKK